MAEIVLLDPEVTLNAVTLTSYVKSATINYEAEAPETTASGDNPRTYLPGLQNWSVDLELNQDYADGTVDETLFGIITGGAAVAVALKADDAAISVNNPEYQGSVILTSYSPVSGSIGDVVTTPVSLQGSGTLTRDVTP